MRYGREFLMQLQSDPKSLSKPANLPPLEIIKDKPVALGRLSAEAAAGWMPTYVKPTLSKGGANKGGAGGRGSMKKEPKKIISVSFFCFPLFL